MERKQRVTESVSSWIIWEAGRACSAGKSNTLPQHGGLHSALRHDVEWTGLCQLPLMNHSIGKQRAPTGGSSHLYLGDCRWTVACVKSLVSLCNGFLNHAYSWTQMPFIPWLSTYTKTVLRGALQKIVGFIKIYVNSYYISRNVLLILANILLYLMN